MKKQSFISLLLILLFTSCANLQDNRQTNTINSKTLKTIEQEALCKIKSNKQIKHKSVKAIEFKVKPKSDLAETSDLIYASKFATIAYKHLENICKQDSIRYINIILQDSVLFDYKVEDLILIEKTQKNYLKHQQYYISKNHKKLYSSLAEKVTMQISEEQLKQIVSGHIIDKTWKIDNQGFDFVKDKGNWYCRFYMNCKKDVLRTRIVFVYSLNPKDKKLYGFHQNVH